MSTFTVESSIPTGKSSEKFGSEFYVKFKEDERAFPLWFKNQPTENQEIDGEIEDGKFKKVKKEWKPENSSAVAPATGSKPAYKDNSDGMRQGMCFNNAANYVATLEFKHALTDSEWATTVFAYAQALYRMGDLNAVKSPENASQDVPENVAAVFGPQAKAV